MCSLSEKIIGIINCFQAFRSGHFIIIIIVHLLLQMRASSNTQWIGTALDLTSTEGRISIKEKPSLRNEEMMRFESIFVREGFDIRQFFIIIEKSE